MVKNKVENLEKYYKKKHLINPTIRSFLRKTRKILYGARALNEHMPPHLDRHTVDFDIYAKKAKKSAAMLEKELDTKFGGDYFYVKPALHKGTFKVMSRVTEEGVADFTKIKEKPPYVTTLDGISYAKLQYLKQRLKSILKKKDMERRWNRTREALKRIKVYEEKYLWQ